jgi:hypothetical protein
MKNLRQMALLDSESASSSAWADALLYADALASAVEKFQVPMGSGRISVDPAGFLTMMTSLKEAVDKGEAVCVEDLPRYGSFIDMVPKNRWKSVMYPSAAPSLVGPTLGWPTESVMPGTVFVIGDRFSGKSYLIAHNLGTEVVFRYGEPLEDVDLMIANPRAQQCTDLLQTLQAAIIMASLGYHVAIDSLRRLVYSLEGAAMEGGVVAGLFDVITDLNNIVSMFGTTIIIAINPMMGDDERVGRLYERVASSCAGAILMSNREAIAHTYRGFDGRVDSNVDIAGSASQSAKPPRQGSIVNDKSFNQNDWQKTNATAEDSPVPEAYRQVGPDEDDDRVDLPREGLNFKI